VANEVFTSSDWNNGIPQADPNNDLTITSSRVTFDTEARNIDAYFYRDMGAAHFDENFEHLLTVQVNGGSYGEVAFWMLSNTINDFKSILDGGEEALVCVGFNNSYIYLMELRNTGQFQDGYNYGQSTPAYITIERDESVGTYGTVYIYIYDDSDRTNLVDTLTVTLHEKVNFRYLFSNCSYNSGTTQVLSGFCENLDLQEVGEEVEKTSSESASGQDVVSAGYPGADLEGVETGGGEETVGQREITASEFGTGVDNAETTIARTDSEYGSGIESSIVSPVFFGEDTGLVTELSILTKDIYGFEAGEGEDILKELAGVGGKSTDMRLHSPTGRTGIQSGKTGMLSKGVNI